jgi:uncharacterized protein (DUF1800 family)
MILVDIERNTVMAARQKADRTIKQVDPTWAWSQYQPNDRQPWDLRMAAHLYRRAAFGVDWSQLQQAIADGPQKTIDKLLKPPPEIEQFNRTYDEFETSSAGSESADNLRAWWLRRMILTPHPLLEKMTLFWHGHFAVSNAKVKNASSMQNYVQLLRKDALGSFESLLNGICTDPAVLLSVGAEQNRKSNPNKDFARVLLEAFTVGPGQFTEKDVTETARAFTGSFIRRGKLQYVERERDTTTKRILGKEGNFTGADAAKILLVHPATSRRIVRKLYCLLISEIIEPNDEFIAPLVESFAGNYDIGKLAETMLRSNQFFSAGAYRHRIKCPVEYALGIVKGAEGMVSTTRLAEDIAQLGLNLCHPPTAKGWAGGKHWINEATLAGRCNLAAAMLEGADDYGKTLNLRAVADSHRHSTVDSAARFISELFCQDDIGADTRKMLTESIDAAGDPETAIRKFTYSVVTLPEFHLA